ncbi:Hypothetical predicted protein [Cloeon dipterum]|nr:Hypothetical predicted protein [Cloeon dipterum]
MEFKYICTLLLTMSMVLLVKGETGEAPGVCEMFNKFTERTLIDIKIYRKNQIIKFNDTIYQEIFELLNDAQVDKDQVERFSINITEEIAAVRKAEYMFKYHLLPVYSRKLHEMCEGWRQNGISQADITFFWKFRRFPDNQRVQLMNSAAKVYCILKNCVEKLLQPVYERNHTKTEEILRLVDNFAKHHFDEYSSLYGSKESKGC